MSMDGRRSTARVNVEAVVAARRARRARAMVHQINALRASSVEMKGVDSGREVVVWDFSRLREVGLKMKYAQPRLVGSVFWDWSLGADWEAAGWLFGEGFESGCQESSNKGKMLRRSRFPFRTSSSVNASPRQALERRRIICPCPTMSRTL